MMADLEVVVDKTDINKQAIHACFNVTYPQAQSCALDVNLTLPGRGITAIFGHSGSGKTTLLRCIAGLKKLAQGNLSVNDVIWQNQSTFTPTHKRPLGYVFQEASLFPHLTAQGNLNYAIKRADEKISDEDYQRVIETMGIETILQQYPQQLSGGQRQRVAIARALLIQPQLLLMDEPLASLDNARKQEILPYLERLRSSFDIPIFYVSHSMDEVARLADHAVVLDEGKVIAQGSLSEVFTRLDLPLGFSDETGAILQGEVVERDEQWHLAKVAVAGGDFWVRDGSDKIGQQVRIRVQARDVSLALSDHDDSSILNRLKAEVIEICATQDEAMALVRLKVGKDIIVARLTQRSLNELNVQCGQQLFAQIKSAAIIR